MISRSFYDIVSVCVVVKSVWLLDPNVDLLHCWLSTGQRHMLLARRDQYKTAAVTAKQAGNEELAIRYIRTAKVTLLRA